MKNYLITYDLRRPGRNYEALFDAIKRLGPWWHYLESVWIVKTNLSAPAVNQLVLPLIDANDSLLVIEVIGHSSAGWLPADAWNWLNRQ